MILLLIFLIISIAGFVILYSSYNEIIETCGAVAGVMGGLCALVCLMLLLGALFETPNKKLEFENSYQSLSFQAAHMDEMELTLTINLMSQVNEYNTRYDKYKYWSKCFWTKDYYPARAIENVSRVELEVSEK